jgi:molybdate transport system substrate-binding protein
MRTFSLLLSLLLLSCSAPINPPPASTGAETSLTVFAAASLSEILSEIGRRFSLARPGVVLNLNAAGSQQLAQQIVQGAPGDIFASANEKQMNAAVESGRIISGTQQVFAHNHLVIIVPTDNPAKLTSAQDLSRPGVKLILAATEVPAGQYSLEFLAKASVDDGFGVDYQAGVLANLLSYEQNVRAVLAKISLGEADAGIVYASDVVQAGGTLTGASQVQRIQIPDRFNVIVSYLMAPLADSPRLELAQQFINYALSLEGQRILADYGFLPASAAQ